MVKLKNTHCQCCQCRRGLPAELGYFEIACRGSKDCWAGGLNLGYFSSLYPHSSYLPVSCQFREFLSLFNVQEHSFHQFQGLRHPREQSISINHFTGKSNCFFRPIGWFWLFYGWKAPNFGKLGVLLHDKNWATLKSLAAGKKANLSRFGALKFGNTERVLKMWAKRWRTMMSCLSWKYIEQFCTNHLRLPIDQLYSVWTIIVHVLPFKPRPTKGGGYHPLMVCLRPNKNAKESDPGQLGHLFLHPLWSFWWKTRRFSNHESRLLSQAHTFAVIVY